MLVFLQNAHLVLHRLRETVQDEWNTFVKVRYKIENRTYDDRRVSFVCTFIFDYEYKLLGGADYKTFIMPYYYTPYTVLPV